MFSLIENAKIVNILSPIDAASAALAATYINMKNCQKATFLVGLGVVGASIGTPAVTLVVADDASGTHSKTIGASTDLGLAEYYKRTTGDTWTQHSVSSSTFALAHNDDGYGFLIEVDAAKMGMFTSTSVQYEATHVRLAIAAPGASCLMAAQCILTGLRYAEDSPPTAIT
jgi:hypothetical protein